MSAQQLATEVYSIIADQKIRAQRFIGWNDRECAANATCKGVSRATIEAGDTGAVIKGITAQVESGAAIDGTEMRIVSDAQGRAIPHPGTGTPAIVGRLRNKTQTATAAGQPVEVHIFVNP